MARNRKRNARQRSIRRVVATPNIISDAPVVASTSTSSQGWIFFLVIILAVGAAAYTTIIYPSDGSPGLFASAEEQTSFYEQNKEWAMTEMNKLNKRLSELEGWQFALVICGIVLGSLVLLIIVLQILSRITGIKLFRDTANVASTVANVGTLGAAGAVTRRVENAVNPPDPMLTTFVQAAGEAQTWLDETVATDQFKQGLQNMGYNTDRWDELTEPQRAKVMVTYLSPEFEEYFKENKARFPAFVKIEEAAGNNIDWSREISPYGGPAQRSQSQQNIVLLAREIPLVSGVIQMESNYRRVILEGRDHIIEPNQ